MTFEEWEDKYRPIGHYRNEHSIQFDWVEDEAYIAQFPDEQVWTEVEVDGEPDEDGIEPTYILPGKHLVNRISYLITAVPHGAEAPNEVKWT